MGRVLCWIGLHRRSPFWRKAYNVQTGYLRYYHACRRCGVEIKPSTPTDGEKR